jgi:hypothetical protein
VAGSFTPGRGAESMDQVDLMLNQVDRLLEISRDNVAHEGTDVDEGFYSALSMLAAAVHELAKRNDLLATEKAEAENAARLKADVTAAEDPVIGRCGVCHEPRRHSECRQVERDETCVYVCLTCGHTVSDQIPF